MLLAQRCLMSGRCRSGIGCPPESPSGAGSHSARPRYRRPPATAPLFDSRR